MQRDLEFWKDRSAQMEANFENVCEIVKSTPTKEEMDKKFQEKDNQIVRLSNELKMAQINAQVMKESNISLTKEVKLLKTRVKSYEQDKIKDETLQQLYLSSRQIKKFMNEIAQYGELFQILQKKSKRNALHDDIMKVEQSYRALLECLDEMRTESEGKELQMMTRDKEYIAMLEDDKLVKESYMEDYVKKNQTLQTQFQDRDMRLRQAQNKLKTLKRELQRIGQNTTTNVQQTTAGLHYRLPQLVNVGHRPVYHHQQTQPILKNQPALQQRHSYWS